MGFCIYCGEKLDSDSRFCTRCGAEVIGADVDYTEVSSTDTYDYGITDPEPADYGDYGYNTTETFDYNSNAYTPEPMLKRQRSTQQPTGSGKKILAWVVVGMASLLLGVVLFFVISGTDPGELINSIFPGNKTNNSGTGISTSTTPTPPPDTDTGTETDPDEPEPPGTEPEDDPVIYITIPDLEGYHKDELETIFKELGLVPEYIYIEDERAEGTVLVVEKYGEKVAVPATVGVLVSLGMPYIYIENPQIVVTARYDSDRRRFADRNSYADAVRDAGGIPILPDDDTTLANAFRTGSTVNVDAIAAKYDGLVLTGGGDISARFFGQERHPASGDPDENCDIVEIALCRAFINAGKPVLGINRGMQVINVAMGGDIIQDIPDILGIASDVHLGNTRHTIQIERGTWLFDMYGSSLSVTSNHHQAVGRIADDFIVVARVGQVIEAIENGNVLGVQFNPERLPDSGSLIYSDFLKRCSYFHIR